MASHERVDGEEPLSGQALGGFSGTLFPDKDDATVPMDQDQALSEDAQSQSEAFNNPSQEFHAENKAGAGELDLAEGSEDRRRTQEEEEDGCQQQVHAPVNPEHRCANESTSTEKCFNRNLTSVTEETQPVSSGERRRADIEQGEQLLQRLQDLRLQRDSPTEALSKFE